MSRWNRFAPLYTRVVDALCAKLYNHAVPLPVPIKHHGRHVKEVAIGARPGFAVVPMGKVVINLEPKVNTQLKSSFISFLNEALILLSGDLKIQNRVRNNNTFAYPCSPLCTQRIRRTRAIILTLSFVGKGTELFDWVLLFRFCCQFFCCIRLKTDGPWSTFFVPVDTFKRIKLGCHKHDLGWETMALRVDPGVRKWFMLQLFSFYKIIVKLGRVNRRVLKTGKK